MEDLDFTVTPEKVIVEDIKIYKIGRVCSLTLVWKIGGDYTIEKVIVDQDCVNGSRPAELVRNTQRKPKQLAVPKKLGSKSGYNQKRA